MRRSVSRYGRSADIHTRSVRSIFHFRRVQYGSSPCRSSGRAGVPGSPQSPYGRKTPCRDALKSWLPNRGIATGQYLFRTLESRSRMSVMFDRSDRQVLTSWRRYSSEPRLHVHFGLRLPYDDIRWLDRGSVANYPFESPPKILRGKHQGLPPNTPFEVERLTPASGRSKMEHGHTAGP
jgi:hypothetical protein